MIVCYSIPSMACQMRPWGSKVGVLTAAPFHMSMGGPTAYEVAAATSYAV